MPNGGTDLFKNDAHLFTIGSVEVDSLTFLLMAAVVALVIQLVLCHKVKNRFIRLIPLLLFATASVAFCVLSAVVNGWDGFGYLYFAFLFGILAAVCGMGILVWRSIKTKK